MLLSDLELLGLTAEEAKVYLALLELSTGYVSAIAKKASVPRVNAYHLLGNLIKKGLVTSFTKNKVKHFTVENPKVLVNQLQDRLHFAQKMLPELLSITNTFAYKPKIHYYEGLQGIKNIFEDTLHTSGEILGYTNLAELPKVVPEKYLRDYVARKIEKGIKSRMLSPLSEEGLTYLKRYYPKGYDMSLTEILFINAKEYGFEYEINLYDDHVSLVSLNPKELIGIIIESPIYATTQRAIFNLAWLGATSFVAR